MSEPGRTTDIAASALKHDVSEKDIWHAIRLPVLSMRQSPERTFVIGAGCDGGLLEIVLIDATSDEVPLVIHAMKLRQKFYKLL